MNWLLRGTPDRSLKVWCVNQANAGLEFRGYSFIVQLRRQPFFAETNRHFWTYRNTQRQQINNMAQGYERPELLKSNLG